MKTIAIIGFGNFGQFAASHLKTHFDVVAFDEHDFGPQAEKAGVKAASLKEATGCDVVLLCVPVQNLESLLRKIKLHLKNGAIVVDVCSVKQKPAELMENILPDDVELIGTHPLFGPQSGKNGINGLQIVLCPVRADKKTIRKVNDLLEAKLGLHVIEMTPSEHDEWMARTQAMAHYVGRAAKELELPDAPFRLATYDALLALRDLVKDDSDALFDTIENENPEAKAQRRRLREKLDEIEKRLTPKTPGKSSRKSTI